MALPLQRISRRGLLKGTCATVLLPFLPSLSWADDPGAPAPRPPKRWVSVLFSLGVLPEHWWAKGNGTSMELSKTLKPLDPHRGLFSVINGLHLFDTYPQAGGPHLPYFCNYLSGALVPTEVPFAMAESCDQLMARTIGQTTMMPSLTLGIEPPPYGLLMGRPAILGGTISWSSPTSPIPPIISPRDAFDALFDTKGLQSQQSILDCVMDDVRDINGKLSWEDTHKLEAYTESVRDLERRIDHSMHPPETGWRPALTEPNVRRPAQDTKRILQQNLGVRHKLMMGILALALQMDKTRVATIVLENDGTGASMNFIPDVTNIGLHPLAHHAAIGELVRQYQLTNEYHVGLFASFLEKLKTVDEGGVTLLDNSMILFGSNVMDGNLHDADKLPLILAGRGGGTLSPGANLTVTNLEDRRLCNLHLAMMQRMGVFVDGKPIQRFGSSIRPLAGI